MSVRQATSHARKAFAAVALGLVTVLAAPDAALGQWERQRITISGETIDDIRIHLSLERIDWSDPESVVRAYAEVKAEMLALPLDEAFDRLGVIERERYYRDIVTPDIEPVRETETIVHYDDVTSCYVLGAREDLPEGDVRFSWEDRSEGIDLRNNRGQLRRTTVRRDGEGRWRIVRLELACRVCDGSGLSSVRNGGRACDQCSDGYQDVPPTSFRQRMELPQAPEVDRADPASVARAVALGDFYIPLCVLGVGDRLMREVREAYYREFLARDLAELVEGAEAHRMRLWFDALPEVAVVSEETPAEGRSRVVVAVTATPNGRGGQREPPSSITARMGIDLIRGDDGSYRAAAVGYLCDPCDASGRCRLCQGRGREPSGDVCLMCRSERRCRDCEGQGFQRHPFRRD